MTHTPNPTLNLTELPPLKLSLVGVWHNIRTRRRLQWQVYSLCNSCVNKESCYNVQPLASHKSKRAIIICDALYVWLLHQAVIMI